MQFLYRLLESQKVQNKRLKRLRRELNVLRCDAFTTSAEGTALTATSWANNIVFEVQTSQLQPSKIPNFGVITSMLLSVLHVFWYTAPWRVVTSHLKTRRPYHAKTSCCTERTVRSIRSAASVFVATLWTGNVFSASNNGSSYIRISPNSRVKRRSTGKTASLNAQFTQHALPCSNSSSAHETVGKPAYMSVQHVGATCFTGLINLRHSFRNVFRQIRSLFNSGYSTECHLVRPLSSIHPLVSLRSTSSCLLLLHRPLVTSILTFFRQWRVIERSDYAKCDQSSQPPFHFWIYALLNTAVNSDYTVSNARISIHTYSFQTMVQ